MGGGARKICIIIMTLIIGKTTTTYIQGASNNLAGADKVLWTGISPLEPFLYKLIATSVWDLNIFLKYYIKIWSEYWFFLQWKFQASVAQSLSSFENKHDEHVMFYVFVKCHIYYLMLHTMYNKNHRSGLYTDIWERVCATVGLNLISSHSVILIYIIDTMKRHIVWSCWWGETKYSPFIQHTIPIYKVLHNVKLYCFISFKGDLIWQICEINHTVLPGRYTQNGHRPSLPHISPGNKPAAFQSRFIHRISIPS